MVRLAQVGSGSGGDACAQYLGVLALNSAGSGAAGPEEFTRAFLWALAFEILVMAVAAALTRVLPRTGPTHSATDDSLPAAG